MSLTRRAIGVVVLLAAALSGPPARAETLTVALPVGQGAATLRRVYLDPFMATGPKLTVATWPGGAQGLTALPADTDVAAMGGAALLAGCQSGRLEKLPWDTPPLRGVRDRMLPQGTTECGLGVAMQATVLAWERGKVQGTPSWADFWDVVRIPGKRALQEGVRGNLELALLADGVLPGDVYRVLRSKAGMELALRKLGQLRPYLVWWKTPDEALRILRSGAALMSSVPAQAVFEANQQGGPDLATQPLGGVTETTYFAIPAASTHQAEALKLLAFAADPARQAMLPADGAWGGLALGANDKLPPDELARSPSAPAALAGSVPIDEGFWRDNLEQLSARFEAMVTP